jgi:hypothetical protein
MLLWTQTKLYLTPSLGSIHKVQAAHALEELAVDWVVSVVWAARLTVRRVLVE